MKRKKKKGFSKPWKKFQETLMALPRDQQFTFAQRVLNQGHFFDNHTGEKIVLRGVKS